MRSSVGEVWGRLASRPMLQRVLQNSSWLALEHFIRLAVGLFVTIWLARYLGPNQFGLFSYLFAMVGVYAVISTLGINANLSRDLAAARHERKYLLGSAIVLRLLGGICGMLLCIVTVALLRPEDGFALILVSVLSSLLLFQATEVITLAFQVDLKIQHPVRAKLLVFIGFAFAKIALILLKAPLPMFIVIAALEGLSVAVVLMTLYRARAGMNALAFHRSYAVELLHGSWPLLIASISSMIYLRADLIMLAELVDESEAGVYAAATRISEAWYFLPMAVMASVQPILVRAKQQGELIYRRRLHQLYSGLAGVSVLVALLVTSISTPLISVLFGEVYSPAAGVLNIHIWAAVAVFLGVASSQFLVIENLQRYAAYRTAFGMIVNLGLNFLLIPRYGAIGAAWATLISYLIATFCIALFPVTRAQAVMMIQAMNPIEWIKVLAGFAYIRGERST